MGCDGGTIPRRDELVKTKKEGERKDKNADIVAKWTYCALSSTPLREPIVSCDLGFLYSKEALIQYLLDKESVQKGFSHVRGLKDVTTLNLTTKPGYKEKPADNGGEYVDNHDSKYICPVVGLDMNGKYRFCYFRDCGCVLSERALKEVKSDVCHNCGKEVNMDDVVVINGTEEEVAQYRKNLEEKRAAEKLRKKSKRKSEALASSEDQGTSGVGQEEKRQKAKIPEKGPREAVLPEKARTSYSVASDPNRSEAYKSLFTTHKSAQNRPKAHWVTYNPLYF